MKRCILSAIVLAFASGCDQSTYEESKVKAESRWFEARATILCRVAEERLKAGQFDNAKQSAKQALALQPNNRKARTLLARVLIEQGEYPPAIAQLEGLLSEDGRCAEAAYLSGVAWERSGKLAEALSRYRQALDADETNIAAAKAAAEVLVAMGELKRAQLQIDAHLPRADGDPGLYELAGRVAMMSKEYDKAAEHYRRARDLDYKNVAYQVALGQALYRAGQYGEALDNLSEVADRKDYQAPTSVYTMLGECHLMAGKPYQAFDAFFTVTEREPELASAWVNLAKSALDMKDAPRAILAARKAIHLDPKELEATWILAYALLRDGQGAEAVRALERAVAGQGDNSMARCLLGRAHAATGNEAEAIRCYKLAIQMDPKNELARELLAAATGKEVSRAD